MKKFTVSSFADAKRKNEKISMLTAYDYSTAKLLDEAGVDTILVGDSLGMVMLGYESTLNVTMDDMVHHVKAVARGVKNAFIVGDMPFLSYHVNIEESIRNAGRLIQAGASSVKLEGGRDMIPVIQGITRAQIPVMGHLGLTPQSINMMGGYKVQAKEEEAARNLIEEALLLEEAGVFAIVLECVPEKLAKLVSDKLSVPTIGIGAGNQCDGQVLVIQDMLGTFENFKPKFVKSFGNIGELTKKAVKDYIKEVKEQSFPGEEHTFSMDETILDKLY